MKSIEPITVSMFRATISTTNDKHPHNMINKLGPSCAKLRSVELKLENNKILGLNEIGMRDIKGKKSRDDKSVVGHNFWMSLAKTKQ